MGKRRYYLYPALAALAMGLVGGWVQHTLRTEMERKLEEDLQTILSADVTALEGWMQDQLRASEFIAGDPQITRWTSELVALAEDPDSTDSRFAKSQPYLELKEYLRDIESRIGFLGFTVMSTEGRILAAPFDGLVGRDVRGPRMANLNRLFETGDSQLIIPLRGFSPPKAGASRNWNRSRRDPGRGPRHDPRFAQSPNPADTRDRGRGMSGIDTFWKRSRPEMDWHQQLTLMLTSALRNEEGAIIGAIGCVIRPEDRFTDMLSAARFGETGESYAFNREAVLISQSRFDPELRKLGLIPDATNCTSVLTLDLRDPGGNLTEGFVPELDRGELPLTHLAESALSELSGVDISGFNDYRGIKVVGAWQWLPQYDIGVAIKVDYEEAFRPLYALRAKFLILIGLLMASTVALLFYSILAVRLQRKAQVAELQARDLGQYRLEEKIGEGGMGVVYRARHALLRRPTALKLLLPSRASKRAIEQFEQEVRLTSRLTHPNTIQIYDYGHTADGIFYYAMELLDGINLKELVRRYGPQPPGRVISILSQICSSLREAHTNGLVHRDIKPANVFLCHRGGNADWVKVLDFGLVKQTKSQPQDVKPGIPDSSVVGTPSYMAPEAIKHPDQVDARADVYGVAALGFFILTGTDLMAGLTLDAIRQRLDSHPMTRVDLAGIGDLEAVIQLSLSQDPEHRPQSIADFQDQLEACRQIHPWTIAEAEAWWDQHQRRQNGDDVSPKSRPGTSFEPSLTVDLAARRGDSPTPVRVSDTGSDTTIADD